jgi:hypothetical protein
VFAILSFFLSEAYLFYVFIVVCRGLFLRNQIQKHPPTTLCRTPLNEWSVRRRELCLTTNNTHNRQTFMPPAGFEPAISGSDQPQTYAFDSAARSIDISVVALWSVFASANCTYALKSRKWGGGGRSEVVQSFSDEIYLFCFSKPLKLATKFQCLLLSVLCTLELTKLVDNLFVFTCFLGSSANFVVSYIYAELPILRSQV